MVGLVSNAIQPAPQANAVAPGQASPMPNGASNGAAPPIPQGVEKPGSSLKNQILNQIESGVEAKIPQQNMQMYESIVVASMDLAFNPKTHPLMLKGLQSSPDIYKNISLICAGMMGVIFEQSKQDPNLFLPAAGPAAITLMCQLLEFAETAGMVEITPEKVAECTDQTVQATLRKFGVDGQKIKQVVDAREQGGQAPAPGVAPTPAQPGMAPVAPPMAGA